MMEAIGPAKAELYKGIDNANVIYYTEKIWTVPNDSSAWLDGISLGLYYK